MTVCDQPTPPTPLDALTDDEQLAVEEQLAECGASLEHLEQGLLGAKVDPVPAPAGMLERLLEQIEDEPAEPAVELKVTLGCTFCHDRLVADEAVYCADCLAPHHRDCFEEHGRCSSMGCAGTDFVERRSVVRAPARRSPQRHAPQRVTQPPGIVFAVIGTVLAAGFAAWQGVEFVRGLQAPTPAPAPVVAQTGPPEFEPPPPPAPRNLLPELWQVQASLNFTHRVQREARERLIEVSPRATGTRGLRPQDQIQLNQIRQRQAQVTQGLRGEVTRLSELRPEAHAQESALSSVIDLLLDHLGQLAARSQATEALLEEALTGLHPGGSVTNATLAGLATAPSEQRELLNALIPLLRRLDEAGVANVEIPELVGEAQQETPLELRRGWFGEALPSGLRRGSESPVYLWDTGHGLEIDMVFVPKGTFLMGADKEERTLPGYWIAREETSWEQFRAFQGATGREVHPQPNDTVQGPLTSREMRRLERATRYRDSHPVCDVTWADAKAFCEWAGLELPTEAEWEKAARGTEGQTYPWGEAQPHAGLANFGKSMSYGYCSHPAGGLEPGKSPYGALNMAGNVWEWCEDPYNADEATGERVIRGGAWGAKSNPQTLRTDHRGQLDATKRVANVGFRPIKRWPTRAR